MVSQADSSKNWETIEDFKKVKQHYRRLKEGWMEDGASLSGVAEKMQNDPEHLDPADEGALTSVPARASERMKDWIETKRKLEHLSNMVRNLGINPDAL